MKARRLGRRLGAVSAGAAITAAALADGRVAADSDSAGCAAWDVEYALSGNLTIADTPMGAGNGTHRVGPGKLVLRFESNGGRVSLLSYEMPEHLVVRAKKIFWESTLNTDAVTRAVPESPCASVAEGELDGRTLRWTTQTTGYRTEGTMTCQGSACGSFGAPPRGSSPLRIGPDKVALSAFQFDRDMQTFTMRSTFVSKTDTPPQTAYVALSGRETRRACAPPSCR
jgi:hypothetical protein